MTQFDFASLYGQADTSNQLVDEGVYDAVIEKAEFGRTKDGTKGQWTIAARISTGQFAAAKLTQTLTISPENPRALGIMFRHLGALGVPVPPAQPFWMLGWSEDQVAQFMTGKPCQIAVKHDEYEGTMRPKIRDWRPARPGAPTDWPRQPQQAPQQPQQGFGQLPAGYPPQGVQGPGGQVVPAAPGGYPQQPPAGYGQPPAPPQQPWGAPPPPQQPGGPAMPPWGQQAPQGAPQAPPAQNPALPPWAQPATPGQGGTAEFTTQGMSQQPAYQQPPAPPASGFGQPPAQPGYPQAPPAPPAPGYPQQPQPGYPPQGQFNGGQPQGQPQPPAQQGQPGEAPPPPPWAQ